VPKFESGAEFGQISTETSKWDVLKSALGNRDRSAGMPKKPMDLLLKDLHYMSKEPFQGEVTEV